MSESDARSPYGFELPLVSVVVVNYNYGAYVEAAIRSVFEQTYGRIECIVLDNASTDNSLEILAEMKTRYPALEVVARTRNDGQSVASVEGFLTTRGPYVCFLDADDVMLPDFIASHIFVHLSLRIPVGFTCSDMFQTLGNDLVLGTFVALNAYVQSGAGRRPDLMRPLDCGEGSLPLGSLKPVDPAAVHFVPQSLVDWPWASMSAFVFRRDALNLVMHNQALQTLASNFDVYLARSVNVLVGSVVIDKVLTVYRMHQSNVFARHVQLNGVFNFDRHGSNDHEQHARRVIIDHLFDTSDTLLRKLQQQSDFFRAVRLLNDIQPVTRSSPGARRTYLQEKLIEAFPRLAKVVPRSLLVYWALAARISPLRALTRSRT